MVRAKTATSAPRASSLASVSGEKYAQVRLTAVWITDQVNEAAMIKDKAPANALRCCAPRVEN
jgi:hypothetical protein